MFDLVGLVKAGREVADIDVASLSDDVLLAGAVELEAVLSAVGVGQARLLGEISRRGLTDERYGQPVARWVAGEAKVDRAGVHRRMKLGHHLRHLPAAEQAVVAGDLSIDHAAVLAEHVANPRVGDQVEATQTLWVERAAVTSFVDWKHQLDCTMAQLDEDGGYDPNRDLARNRLRLTPFPTGSVGLTGELVGEQGLVVRHNVEAHADRLYHRLKRDHDRCPELPLPNRSTLLAMALAELVTRGATVDPEHSKGPVCDVTLVIEATQPDHTLDLTLGFTPGGSPDGGPGAETATVSPREPLTLPPPAHPADASDRAGRSNAHRPDGPTGRTAHDTSDRAGRSSAHRPDGPTGRTAHDTDRAGHSGAHRPDGPTGRTAHDHSTDPPDRTTHDHSTDPPDRTAHDRPTDPPDRTTHDRPTDPPDRTTHDRPTDPPDRTTHDRPTDPPDRTTHDRPTDSRDRGGHDRRPSPGDQPETRPPIHPPSPDRHRSPDPSGEQPGERSGERSGDLVDRPELIDPPELVDPYRQVDRPTTAGLTSRCGPAHTPDGYPVDPHVAAVLLCDPAIHALIVDSLGVALDLGRTTRYANREQRRALAHRDGGCVFPGCDAPVGWCDAHHIRPWDNGGHTNLDNLALLCRYHHGITHRAGWTMTALADQTFTWTTPLGQTLTSQRHRGRSPTGHRAT